MRKTILNYKAPSRSCLISVCMRPRQGFICLETGGSEYYTTEFILSYYCQGCRYDGLYLELGQEKRKIREGFL